VKKGGYSPKEEIVNALKFMTMTIVMTIGFWVIYAMIWIVAELPEANWSMWALFGLALLSEFGFIKWLSN
jgi:hypothetical protein